MRAALFSTTIVLVAATLARSALAADDAVKPWAHKPGLALYATAFVGDGLRFNDPYRLATPLGSTAQSVSRSALYTDVGIAVTFGDPLGWQHGLALRSSIALEGVQQGVVTPSYLLWRRGRLFAAYARAGLPIVLGPDANAGGELGLGGVVFVRGGIGVAGELVGDLFFGAGTREAATPAYPMLSAQIGLVLAYEMLPR